jgi:gag-polypeptide of LTR copia-type
MSDIKILEKDVGILQAGRWQQWSRKCKASLQSQGLWSYIKGPNKEKPTDLAKLGTWSNINDRIVGALCQVVNDVLMRNIEDFVTAHEAWEYLKSKTYQRGIISKMNALQAAIRIQFTTHEAFDSTISELKDQLAIIYDQKLPSEEEQLVVLLLQALTDGDFEWICKNLISFMTTSTTSLTSADINAHLEAEFQELNNKKNQETALAARSTCNSPLKTNRSTLTCTNCDAHGHTVETCWEKGSGAEGQMPDWYKELKAKKKKKKSKPTANAAVAEDEDSGTDS